MSNLHKISFILLCTLLTLGSSSLAYSKDKKYAVEEIPMNLRLNSWAVLRADEQVFTVLSEGKGKFTQKYAYTIFSEKAESLSQIQLHYSLMRKINTLQGKLYDQYGNEIGSLKKSDIRDESAISGISVHEDSRVKYATLSSTKYPYTVEFEYEILYDGLLFYPNWYPQEESYIGIEQASFQVRLPADMELRYKGYNVPEVKKSQEGGLNIYEWSLKNTIPAPNEPYAAEPLKPLVLLAPAKFSFGKVQGDLSSWKSFGEWQANLNKDCDDLPEITKKLLQEKVKGIDSELEKVRIVYEYLQSKTRYVGIQLGIGGWQPFKASLVDAKSYGDCKALSNYTKNLLDAVNIPSYYTLVKSGDNVSDVPADFPSNRFNHVILCVPLRRDTVWLECTSQTNPFGYLGKSNGDRNVLLVTPEGGKLVRTPTYGKNQNIQSRFAQVSIQENGDALAQITTQYSALKEGSLPFIIELNTDTQKKWLSENISIPSFEIKKFDWKRQKDRVPVITENLELIVRKCITISGKRIFLVPNLMNKVKNIPSEVEKRLSDVHIKLAYQEIDSIQYALPEGYQVEHLPEVIEIKSDFGVYKVTHQLNGGQMLYIRTLEINKGTFPKEKYQELIDFKKNIMKADQTKVVFVKET